MSEPMKSDKGLATCNNDVFFILWFLHRIATFVANLVSSNTVPLIPQGIPSTVCYVLAIS